MLSLHMLFHNSNNWRRIDKRRRQLLECHTIATLRLLHNGRCVNGVNGGGGGAAAAIGGCIGGAGSAPAVAAAATRRITLRDGYQCDGGIAIMLQQIIYL